MNIPDYRWESNEQAGMRIELPGTWTVEPSALDLPHAFAAKSPDGKIRIEYVFITQGAVEVAHHERAMLAALDKQVSDVKVTKPASRAMQHGLHVFGIAGSGHREEHGVDWVCLAFGDGKGHGLLLNVVADDGEVHGKAATITRITMSVSPLPAAPGN